MTLQRALKTKNRLVSKLNEVRADITTYNRHLEGNEPEVDVDELLDVERRVMEALVQLKSEISEANAPVQHLILRMVELKGRINFLNGVPTQQGATPANRWDPVDSETSWRAQMTKEDVDWMLREAKVELDTIEDKLAAHNGTTEIDIEIPQELMF